MFSSDAPARASLRGWPAPALLLALALAVRAVGLTWGLPNAGRWYSYHPDESVNQIVGAVVHLLQGDWNPHFFNYPSLSIYATWLVYQGLAIFGLTTVAPAPTYPWPLVRDIIFAGRLLSVVCGAGTAALSYGVARQLGLGRGALVAGVIVALLPGLVQHSHYATVDVPATFLVTLCVWLALRARTGTAILISALVAGLAAGTKYNAGLVVVAPMACAALLPDLKNRWGLIALAPLIALLGFVLTTPYALIAPAEFWGDSKSNGFAYELLVHPRIGHGEIFQNTGNGWWYHLTFNLPFVMTAPLEIFALIGLGFAARERRWWPILAFVGIFFLSLGFSQVRFMRYLFPLAPFLSIAAAWAAARLPKPTIWGAGLVCVVALVTPDILRPFVTEDSRDTVAQMIQQSGGKPVGLAHPPWFYTPPFQPVGLNVPVPGTVVTGFDVAKLRATKPPVFAISEFEYREALRLHPRGEVARFLDALDETYADGGPIPPTPLIGEWGRQFAPHDFLYNHPVTNVYLSPR